MKKFDPKGLYSAHGLYHNAVEVEAGQSLIFSSGIIGCTIDGELIKDPTLQIQQAWQNVA